MLYRFTIFCLLLFSSIAVIGQDDPDSVEVPVTAIGDHISLTLDADEMVIYQLDVVPGESMLLNFYGEISGYARVFGAEDRFLGEVLNRIPIDRVVASGEGPYRLEIKNTDDVPGIIALKIDDVAAHTLDIGEQYRFDALQAYPFEVIFEGQAGQTVVVETSTTAVSYSVEYIDNDDGLVTPVLWSMTNLHPITGISLSSSGTYRVVVNIMQPDAFDGQGTIEIRAAEQYADEITVGEIIEGTVDVALFSTTIDLARHEAIRVTFESEGAQTYINDSNGRLITYFGHAAVTHQRTEMAMIAPSRDTYTIYAYNPAMGEVFDGDYRLSVEAMSVTMLADAPETVSMTRDAAQYLMAEVSADTHYRLTLSNPDGAEGGIGARVYWLDGDTLLREDSPDFADIQYEFEVMEDGFIGIELRVLNGLDAPVTVMLERIDGED